MTPDERRGPPGILSGGGGRVAAVPNDDPDGSNWAVLFAGFTPEDDVAEQLAIVCFTDDTDDLPGVTEVEHRFILWEDSVDDAHAVYYGVSLHRHTDEGEPGCEWFRAADGEAAVEDIPDDLRAAFADIMDMEIHPPGDEPVDADPVLVEDALTPDTDPGGMFQ